MGIIWALALGVMAITGRAHAAENEPTIDMVCEWISDKLASVSLRECMNEGLVESNGRSVKDTPILYKEYPALPGREPLARVLLFGGIHGDEYASVSIVFKWMKILNRHHSGLFNWVMVPVLNPDGLLEERSRRMNANSVDLNRNFPMPDWEEQVIGYWVKQTKRHPKHFPGTGPMSEPETRWLVDEIKRFRPDVIVSVNAPVSNENYDLSSGDAYKLGRLYLNLLGTYPGSLGNYAGVQNQIEVVTVELPYAETMPSPAEISSMWVDLVRWLRRNSSPTPLKADHKEDREPS
ncbi:MAG: DUF2817 domain-containing protein [Gammaproteobacteria bacterium]|nr:DUF2817 domain-containing protein [Gammaproteobacteria bacterium]